MAETALAAAYRAIHARLAGGNEAWGTSVYADVVPAGASFPLVTYFWTGGGDVNGRRGQDAELMIAVKAVSYSQPEAFTLAARISELLDNHGITDNSADSLNGGNDWYILTCTQEEAIHQVDLWSGTRPIYHAGARYRLVMEVK